MKNCKYSIKSFQITIINLWYIDANFCKYSTHWIFTCCKSTKVNFVGKKINGKKYSDLYMNS